jgi:hypothetical protein
MRMETLIGVGLATPPIFFAINTFDSSLSGNRFCAWPRLRQSHAALGSGYGLNEEWTPILTRTNSWVLCGPCVLCVYPFFSYRTRISTLRKSIGWLSLCREIEPRSSWT